MSDEKPKSTGRTVFDFLTTIYESRSVLHISNAIAWAAVVVIVSTIYAGYLVPRSKTESVGSSTGSPWVHSETLYTSVPQGDCQNFALQTTSHVSPSKVGKRFDDNEYFTQFLEFGDFTAWISCIAPHPGTMIYVGVAGNDDDKAHEVLSRLTADLKGKLPRPQ
jgi:hypothetical protein